MINAKAARAKAEQARQNRLLEVRNEHLSKVNDVIEEAIHGGFTEATYSVELDSRTLHTLVELLKEYGYGVSEITNSNNEVEGLVLRW